MSRTKKKVVAIDSGAILEDSLIKSNRNSSKVVYRQTTAYDGEGNIVYDNVSKSRSQNGSGFVISYTEKMCEFISKVSTGSVVRLFLYIAHHQNYGTDGKTFGYRCSHKYLMEVLHVSKPALWEAFKYLKENFLVNETKIDGQTEFMVNPQYVTIGTDKKARVREWNRRWEQHWKNINGRN